VNSRVKGLFPRQAFNRFISAESVNAAMQRPVEINHDPLVLGIDVARFGDDMSVIYRRKGLDARTHLPMKYRNIPLDRLEDKVMEFCTANRVSNVFVDGTGVGGSLTDYTAPAWPARARRRRPRPDWAAVHRELRRPGMTLQLLWEEHRAVHPDGYGYSRFCGLYRTWEARLSPTMRQSRVAGERMFVDYAGTTLTVIDGLHGDEQLRRSRLTARGPVCARTVVHQKCQANGRSCGRDSTRILLAS
jgi:hypothetical protein